MLGVISYLDTHSYLWFIRVQNSPRLIASIRLISRTGDGYLYAIFATLLYINKVAHYREFAVIGLTAFLFELPCFMGLKAAIKRDRPHVVVAGSSSVINPHDKFSMPSGHTAAAFLMAGLISYFYPGFSILVYFWASLIGMSRIALGVHYPSDILAGALLGSCCTLIAIDLIL